MLFYFVFVFLLFSNFSFELSMQNIYNLSYLVILSNIRFKGTSTGCPRKNETHFKFLITLKLFNPQKKNFIYQFSGILFIYICIK